MRSECTPSNGQDHAEVFRMLADAVQEHLHSQVDADTVRQIVDERIGQATLPRPVEVHLPDGTVNKLDERPHRQFDELIELVNEGHRNILMVGPAGSGKTTLAKSLAKGLGLEFGFISLSAGVTETHLLGRVLPQSDGSWQYQPSLFVQMYERGGVFLLDELDAADANVMVAINAALANGVLANPVTGAVHVRHEKFYVLAAANTWGRGGDNQYVGRNQLDAATLDRFILSTLHVQYDGHLESNIASTLPLEQGADLIAWVEQLREAITRNRLRRIASTRLIVNSVSALKAGRSLDQVKARYFQDWSADEKAKVAHA